MGTIFQDRYRIEDVLGRGGFGSVYRATQLAIGRSVAIKVLHESLADDLKEVARFQQEARAMARVRHPNVVQLIDFGQTAERNLYLVTEFLEGRTLKDVITDEAPLEPDRAIDYLVAALDGLAEAHAQGVVHRDLKPENLFIAKIGRREEVVKVLDFGIAKVTGDAAASMTLTQTGVAIGSPRYMSPEQARSQPVSAKTDLYLAGIILYEMLTGWPVFERNSPTDYLLAHIHEPPPPPQRRGKPLKGPLIQAMMQLLAKEPRDRPASADEAVRMLQSCRGNAVTVGEAGDDSVDELAATLMPGTIEYDQFAEALATSRYQAASPAPAAQPLPPPPSGVWPGQQGPAVPSSSALVAAIVAAVLLVAAAGGAAWWFLGGKTAASSSDRRSKAPSAEVESEEEGDDEEGDEQAVVEVTLESTPPGAKVVVGGLPVGRTPHTLSWPAGEDAPAVRLESDGYAPLEIDLEDAEPDETLELELTSLDDEE